MAESVGGIYIEIEIETANLLSATKVVDSAMGSMESSAKDATRGVDKLDKSTKNASGTINQMASNAKSMDASLQTLNTTASAIAVAINDVRAISNASNATFNDMSGSLKTLISAVNSLSTAMKSAGSSTSGANSELSRADALIEGLGNQIAILEEAQEGSARSAAVLAAQLRAGSNATDAEKQKIGDLAGRLFDMRNTTDAGAKSHGNWRSSMQQAGYQVQDFIVQVQGGQSALVAFSQQGSQLAGAFGPSGAIVGAIIALGSVIVGTLVKSMGSAEDQMKTMATATNALNDIINISQSGVAALSDKYALLAKTNAEAATILRNQALIEYNQAVAKIPDAMASASKSIIGLGDAILSGLGGGYASVQNFGSAIESLGIKTDDYKLAVEQAQSAGVAFSATTNGMVNTVGAIAKQFGISEQQAFLLAKQLDEVSKTKSPETLQELVIQLQKMKSSTNEGQQAITTFVGKLVDLVREAANAKANVSALKGEMDNLTQGQKSLIQQSQRELALSKLQGAARARLQALYKAEDAGLSGDSPQAMRLQDEAEQAYKNTDAQKKNNTEGKKSASQAESVAQKLASLKQQSELAASSTEELSREQAILQAQQSLGKGATQEQIKLAGEYRAKAWDAAAAAKGVAEALKAMPVQAENKSYADSMQNLKAALNAGKIDLQEYNSATEKMALEHQNNLAKINASQTVNPVAEARGEIDPVQQLANQNSQKLALMQQYQAQEQDILKQSYDAGKLSYDQYVIAKQATDAQYLALRTAQDKQYQEQQTASQWQLLSQQSLGYNMLTSAVDSLSGNASNAITGLLTGTMSAQEAMQSLGNTILNSVINSIVQVGVEMLKNFILSQTMGAATQTANAAAATAGGAAALAAWTPAAIAASIATGGAASTTGLTAYQGAQTAGLAMSVLGARKNGGPVSANSMYRVGESGMPEIYKASNGSQYMIPGDNGKVISNKDMQGQVQVNIQFYDQSSGGQHSLEAQASQDGNVVTVDAFLNDLDRGGPMASGMMDRFGLSMKARGAY